MNNRELIDLLHRQQKLEANQWEQLFAACTAEELDYAMELARKITIERFGKKIYFLYILFSILFL